MLRHAGVVGLVFGMSIASGGCGGGDAIKLVKATGVVVFQGKPLDGATVVFVPAKGPLAMGTANKDGKFTLFTGTSPGVVAGKCGVSVALYPADKSDDDLKGLSESERNEKLTQSMGKDVGQYGLDKPASILPSKFADAKTSGLEVTVTDDPTKNFFELKL